MGFTDALDKTEADIDVSDGDHERYAHYVERNDAMLAYVEGKPIIALCGKIWVPHKDPEKFPICPTCKDIFDALFLT
jgi:hypothetical protein